MQSLLSSVAKKVEVNVDYDANLEIEKIYGYAPHLHSNNVSISLENMNSGLTQVVMMRFHVKNPSKNSYPVKVRLSYFDVKKQRMVEEVQELKLNSTDNKAYNLLEDTEVKKNYTIAELAQSLADMTTAAKAKNYGSAENFLNDAVAETYRRFPNMEDKDIKFILNIVEGYQRDLKTFNRNKGWRMKDE